MEPTSRIVRFVFAGPPEPAALTRDVSLALFCAEGLYGPARLRLEASHAVAEDGRTCVVAVHGEAGDAVVRLLTAFCAARVGEDGFSVEHVVTNR